MKKIMLIFLCFCLWLSVIYSISAQTTSYQVISKEISPEIVILNFSYYDIFDKWKKALPFDFKRFKKYIEFFISKEKKLIPKLIYIDGFDRIYPRKRLNEHTINQLADNIFTNKSKYMLKNKKLSKVKLSKFLIEKFINENEFYHLFKKDYNIFFNFFKANKLFRADLDDAKQFYTYLKSIELKKIIKNYKRYKKNIIVSNGNFTLPQALVRNTNNYGPTLTEVKQGRNLKFFPLIHFIHDKRFMNKTII